MEKDEITESFKRYLKNLLSKINGEYELIYEKVDNELVFPSGSTKSLLPELVFDIDEDLPTEQLVETESKDEAEPVEKIPLRIVKKFETRVILVPIKTTPDFVWI